MPSPAEALLTGTEELGALSVLDEQGHSILMSSLWKTRPAVLVFVRHFG